MDGFIYILSNSAFNTLKIGRTSKAPEERRRELSSETGVPAPYKIEYYAFVENYESVERQVHLKLDSNRPQKNKEHFTCSVPEAIIVIENIANIKYKEIFYKSPDEIQREKIRQEEVRLRKEAEEKLRLEERKKEADRIRIEKDKEHQLLKIKKQRDKEIMIEETTGSIIFLLEGIAMTFLLFWILGVGYREGLHIIFIPIVIMVYCIWLFGSYIKR